MRKRRENEDVPRENEDVPKRDWLKSTIREARNPKPSENQIGNEQQWRRREKTLCLATEKTERERERKKKKGRKETRKT